MQEFSKAATEDDCLWKDVLFKVNFTDGEQYTLQYVIQLRIWWSAKIEEIHYKWNP